MVEQIITSMYGENAFAIMGAVNKELTKRKMHEQAKDYLAKAQSSDYHNLNMVSQEFARMIDHVDAHGSLEDIQPIDRNMMDNSDEWGNF